MIGKIGTNGTRNARGKSGCVFRKISTAKQTNVNAVNVPMLTRFASMCKSNKPASAAAPIPIIHVFTKGTLNF